MVLRILAITLLAVLVGACSTSRGSLRYVAPATSPASTDAGVVAIGRFSDERGEPVHWLGAIRGGFGNPVKKIEAEVPVAEIVQAAFTDAARARGLLRDSGAAVRIEGVVRRLDGDKVARSESNAEILVRVVDARDGSTRFERTYTAKNIEGSALTFKTGVFASVDELRALIALTLSQAVDKALDDSALRSALSGT